MTTLRLAIDAARARIGAREFEKATERARISARRFERETSTLGSTVDRFGRLSGGAATQLRSLVGVLAGIAAARGAVRTLASFEETLLTVQGVAVDTSRSLAVQAAQFEALEAAAREAGATTRFSASQAGEGLLFLARAGFDANEAIEALPDTLNLAVAGVLDLGEAADIASNVLKQFGLQTEETGRVADVLVRTANNANTDVRQLAEALKLAGPIAAAAGRDLEETARAVGVLGDAGVQGSLAGTNLRGVLLGLAAPTSKARRAFERLGLTASSLNPEINSLTDIFRRLKPALEALPEGERLAALNDIFGRRNAAAAAILAENVDRLGETYNETGRSAAELAELQDSGLVGSFKALVSATQEAVLGLGREGGVGGALQEVVDVTTDAIRIIAGVGDVFGDAAARAQGLAVAIQSVGLAIAAAGVTKFILVLGRLILQLKAAAAAATGLGVALAANPIGAIATAVGLAAAAYLSLSNALDSTAQAQRRLTEEQAKELEQLRQLQPEVSDLASLYEIARRAAADPDAGARDRLAALETELETLEKLVEAGEEAARLGGTAPVGLEIVGELDVEARIRELREQIGEVRIAAALEIDQEAELAKLREFEEAVRETSEKVRAGQEFSFDANQGVRDDILAITQASGSLQELEESLKRVTLEEQFFAEAQRQGVLVTDEQAAKFADLALAQERLLEGTRERLAAEEAANANLGDFEAELRRQLEFAEATAGLTEEEIALQARLAEARELAAAAGLDEDDQRLKNIEERIRKLAELEGKTVSSTDLAEDANRAIDNAGRSAGRSIGNGLADLAEGSKELEDVLEDLTRVAIQQLTRIAVASALAGAAGGVPGPTGVSGVAARGGVFEGGGRNRAFASGGILDALGSAGGAIVDREMSFPNPSGGRNIVGEAGAAEAVLPLQRDSRGRLGVSGEIAAGGGPMTVVQNIQTPDLDGFRRSRRSIERDARRGFGRGS